MELNKENCKRAMIRPAYEIFVLILCAMFYFMWIITGCITGSFLYCTVRHEKSRRSIIGFYKKAWLELTTFVFGRYFKDPVHIQYNPKILEYKKAIIISNHLTNYDWLFILTAMQNFGKCDSVCVMLKKSVSKIPFIGYGMKMLGFIFLDRDIRKDEKKIKSGCKSLLQSEKYDLLLFPEGTIITKETHEKSENFAKSRNISFNPTECLLPRTTGFNLIKEVLKDDIDGIIDFTLLSNPYVQYPCTKRLFWDVFVKRSQNTNFILCVDAIDRDEALKQDFLYDSFRQKNALIEKYMLEAKDSKILQQYEFTNICRKMGRKHDGYAYAESRIEPKYGIWFLLPFMFLFICFSLIQLMPVIQSLWVITPETLENIE